MRESPSPGDRARRCRARVPIVRAFDPEGMREADKLLPDVDWCQDAYHALEGADAAVILTEWNEFRGLDLERAREVMRAPLSIDLRNIFDPAQVAAAGFDYISIGRPSVCRPPPSRVPAQRNRLHARPGPQLPPDPAARVRHSRHRRQDAVSPPTRAPSATPSAPCACAAAAGRWRLGFDGRLSSPELADAAAPGPARGRARGARRSASAPTPMLYFAVHHLERRWRRSRSPARTIRPTTTASR